MCLCVYFTNFNLFLSLIYQACDKFIYCSDGIPNEHPCPPGLIFDEESSNCDWKESVNRQCDHPTKGKKNLCCQIPLTYLFREGDQAAARRPGTTECQE